MKQRLPALVLAVVALGALVAQPDVRTVPIAGALAVVFGWGVARPDSLVAVLLAPAAIGAASLAPFSYALTGTTVVLLVLAWTARRSEARSSRHQRGRLAALGLPSLAIVAVLLVALGLGDISIGPADRGSRDEPQSLPAGPLPSVASDVFSNVSSEGRVIDPVDLERARLEAARDFSRVGASEALVLNAEAMRNLGGISQVSDSSGSSSRTPWLVALFGIAVAIFTLFASRRFGNNPIEAPAGTDEPVTPTPLDWYDRIAEAAGHPRHPADPVLRHSRDVAAELGDDRFIALGRLVSDHAYDGRELTDADFELFRSLRSND